MKWSTTGLAFLFTLLTIIHFQTVSARSAPDINSNKGHASGFDLEFKAITPIVEGCAKAELPIEILVLNHSKDMVHQFLIELFMNGDSVTRPIYTSIRAGDSMMITLKDKFISQGAGNFEVIIRHDSLDTDISNNDARITYQIKPTPEADFDVEDGCEGDSTYFLNRTVFQGSDSLTFIWRFGDADMSTDRDVTHLYRNTQNGQSETFMAWLEATANGCSNFITKPVTVFGIPDANFEAGLTGKELVIYNQATTDSDLNYQWEFGDGNRSTKVTPNHTYSQKAKYRVCLTLSRPIGCKAKICKLTGSTSFVKGRAYIDQNNNCSYDQKDLPYRGIIRVDSSYFTSSTDSAGLFYLPITSDKDYTIRQKGSFSLDPVCNSDSLVIVKAQADKTYKHDFIFKIDSSKKDLSIYIGHGRVRKGRKVEVVIKLHANSSYNANFSEIEFRYNSHYTITGSSDTYTNVQPGFAKFKVKTPNRGQSKWIKINLLDKDVRLDLNDVVIFKARVLVTDNNPKNNQDSTFARVLAPYDPNAKTSFPDSGLLKRVEEVHYVVQFQNIGSAPAQDVVVYDYLDSLLPAWDIEVTGTSHPDQYSLEIQNQLLKWTFKNIELPDSNSDPEGSQGFISYKAKVAKGFKSPGDSIHNKAIIYFDFEDGIHTNTASIYIIEKNASISSSTLPSHIRVFPNPVSDHLTLENRSLENDQLVIYNTQGIPVKNISIKASQTLQIDLSQYASGVYYVHGKQGKVAAFIKQ